MQNLLVILFPLLIDGINSLAGFNNSKVKFWVSIISSILGGALLNLPSLQYALQNPNLQTGGTFLTLVALVVASTQGIYLKYWENHPVRASLVPTVAAPSVAVSAVKPVDQVAE